MTIARRDSRAATLVALSLLLIPTPVLAHTHDVGADRGAAQVGHTIAGFTVHGAFRA